MKKIYIFSLTLLLFNFCNGQRFIRLEFWSDRYSDDRVFISFLIKDTTNIEFILKNKSHFIEKINNTTNRIYYDDNILLDMYIHNKKDYGSLIDKNDTSFHNLLYNKCREFIKKMDNSTIDDTLLEYKNGQEICVLKLSSVRLNMVCHKNAMVGINGKCRMFSLDLNQNIILNKEKVSLTCLSNILCLDLK